MTLFNIEALHPIYRQWYPAWRIMRDAIGGDDDVKARGEVYLPMKSAQAAMDDLTLRASSYDAYKFRAEYPELVAPTIVGQVGMINSQPPTVELPARMEALLGRATLDGLTLDDLVAQVNVEILSTGRCGLLPSFDADGQPYLAPYTAESIRNWDDPGRILNYVVLDESGDTRDPETNEWKHEKRFRELRMSGTLFESREWQQGDGGVGPLAPKSDWTAFRRTSTTGSPVDFMPFVIMGTRNLSADPDDVPLYGLAKIALRMYRLDADYQYALHMTSEPTPWISGYENPVEARQQGQIPTAIGAGNLWIIPKGGTCGFLEFSGPGLAAQATAIAAEREAAATFGARMFDETNRSPESGESRKMRYTHTTASLKTISKVACAGVERALRNLAVWMAIDPDTVNITPNLDWVTDTMAPAELEKLVASWQNGAISYETLFDQLKAGKIVSAERTLEDEVAAILKDPLRDELSPELDPADPEAGGMLASDLDPASPDPNRPASPVA